MEMQERLPGVEAPVPKYWTKHVSDDGTCWWFNAARGKWSLKKPGPFDWLRDNHIKPSNACAVAASDGDLEMLKWLRENGCRPSKRQRIQ